MYLEPKVFTMLAEDIVELLGPINAYDGSIRNRDDFGRYLKGMDSVVRKSYE